MSAIQGGGAPALCLGNNVASAAHACHRFLEEKFRQIGEFAERLSQQHPHRLPPCMIHNPEWLEKSQPLLQADKGAVLSAMQSVDVLNAETAQMDEKVLSLYQFLKAEYENERIKADLKAMLTAFLESSCPTVGEFLMQPLKDTFQECEGFFGAYPVRFPEILTSQLPAYERVVALHLLNYHSTCAARCLIEQLQELQDSVDQNGANIPAAAEASPECSRRMRISKDVLTGLPEDLRKKLFDFLDGQPIQPPEAKSLSWEMVSHVTLSQALKLDRMMAAMFTTCLAMNGLLKPVAWKPPTSGGKVDLQDARALQNSFTCLKEALVDGPLLVWANSNLQDFLGGDDQPQIQGSSPIWVRINGVRKNETGDLSAMVTSLSVLSLPEVSLDYSKLLESIRPHIFMGMPSILEPVYAFTRGLETVLNIGEGLWQLRATQMGFSTEDCEPLGDLESFRKALAKT